MPVTKILGEAPPRNLVVLPVVFEDEVKAVLELASFHRFTEIHLTFLEQLAESLKGHPHFMMPDGSIEIVEMMPIPGM